MKLRRGLMVSGFVLGFAVCSVSQITNGNFEAGFTAVGNDMVPDGWTVYETRSATETTIVSNVADPGPSGGSTAMDFHRPQGFGSGDWTSIEQDLCVDVAGAQTATLTLDVKVMLQSLFAGGCCGFEWPAHVLVSYIDTAGQMQSFMWGFHTGPSTYANNTQVSSNTWSTQTIDLLANLTNPAHLFRLRVGGSGHAFRSRIDNVQLAVTGGSRLYPGTGEDLELQVLRNGVADCRPVVIATAGDLIEVRVDSPFGTFNGAPLLVAAEIFTPGATPNGILPGLHVSGNPVSTHILAGGPVSGLGTPWLLPANGANLAFAWPSSLTGQSVMLQAMVLAPAAANGAYATPDAREVR